ncbi:MAG: hypothetical protein ACYDGR_09850 [Candidatus Dormibacteria bacterium]
MKSSLGAHQVVLPTKMRERRSTLERIRAAIADRPSDEVADMVAVEVAQARRGLGRRFGRGSRR